jgi:ABC-type sulfate transport system permease subunit
VRVLNEATPLHEGQLVATIEPEPEAVMLAPVLTIMFAVVFVPLPMVANDVLPAVANTGDDTVPSASTHTQERVFCVFPS